MLDRGFEPGFSTEIDEELRQLRRRITEAPADLRPLLWCSIDNDDSRDLDQLTLAEAREGGVIRIHVAVADVVHLVERGSAIDMRAEQNTTSVYTPGGVFPMLPEQLSTDRTSLNAAEDRMAFIVTIDVAPDGGVTDAGLTHALVHNHAKLVYEEVAAWLDDETGAPAELQKLSALAENLRLQDEAANRMRSRRHQEGALDLETIEARAIVRDGRVADLRQQKKNRARLLIEDFMIAANGATARFLESRGYASIRRVVREPSRWDRIVAVASEHGHELPGSPDPVALEAFLLASKQRDPLRFPDLSLTIVKLLGRGEYVVHEAGDAGSGHFGLAVGDYGHSTAPNRRYPDLITQRVVRAAIDEVESPYSTAELSALAEHCTTRENDADKVERLVNKAAAALLLCDRIGERFEAIVTGASSKGTWVRLLRPPVEGKLVQGTEGLDVGERLRVKLIEVEPSRGFIDFARVR